METKTCVLVPCYRERDRIGDVVRACLDHVRTVVVVDDGSADGTAEAARSAGAEVVVHPENRGKGVALSTGFQWALEHGCEAVVTLDGDGQHSPEEIPRFIQAAADPDVHIVLGCRMTDVTSMPALRRWSNRTTSRWVSRVGHIDVRDSQSGFRLIKAEVLRRVRLTGRRYDAESELLIKAGRAGFKVREIPISTIYTGGKSSINPILDSFRFVKLILRSLITS